jgi:hypothetical protein
MADNTKPKDPAAVELGRKGGRIGGAKKVAKGFSRMDPERRAQIARDAAAKRWEKIEEPGTTNVGAGKSCTCGTCASCRRREKRQAQKASR